MLFTIHVTLALFLKYFIYLFLETEEGKKERERNMDVREKYQLVASHMCPYWGLNPQPRMCPDWELNWQPFTLRDNARLTELQWSKLTSAFLCLVSSPIN